jgi:hypothetical protein
MADVKRRVISRSAAAEAFARGEKWCPQCLRFRRLKAFSIRTRSPSGRESCCRKCKLKRSRRYLEERRGTVDLTIADRWHGFVDQSPRLGGHWLWTGCNHGPGRYGAIMYQGRNTPAHRVGFILYTGYPLEIGEKLRNQCGLGAKCVRPDHWDLPARANKPKLITKRGMAARARMDSRLVAEINAAVPKTLPVEVQEEMRQELCILALTGKQSNRRVKAPKVKIALRRAWDDAFPQHAGMSLDEPIGNDDLGDDFTLLDLYDNRDQSIWSDPASLADIAKRAQQQEAVLGEAS